MTTGTGPCRSTVVWSRAIDLSAPADVMAVAMVGRAITDLCGMISTWIHHLEMQEEPRRFRDYVVSRCEVPGHRVVVELEPQPCGHCRFLVQIDGSIRHSLPCHATFSVHLVYAPRVRSA